MSEQKWTPAPWVHYYGSRSIWNPTPTHRSSSGTSICVISSPHNRDDERVKANGALICAAPDLFKELDAVCEFDEHIGWCPHCDGEARQFCADAVALLLDGYERRKAAIKKAVGQ